MICFIILIIAGILITESLIELLDWLVTFEEKYSGKASVTNANKFCQHATLSQHSPFPEIVYMHMFHPSMDYKYH